MSLNPQPVPPMPEETARLMQRMAPILRTCDWPR